MPTSTRSGWLRYNYEDPADRRELIENGAIWRASPKAQSLAIQDLIDGTVPVNDLVPPEVVEYVNGKKSGA